MTAETRLRELGITLPDVRPAAGNYVAWTRSGRVLELAGQGADGWVGRVGDDLALEHGRRAARACALNLLAQTRAALGTLDDVEQVLRVTGYVACAEGFTDLPEVVDGASDLLVDVLGDHGRHARTAVGVWMLPRGFAVEVQMTLEVTTGVGSYRHRT